MSFDEAKRERIKTYLLEKIDTDDSAALSKVADAFGISITSVIRYVNAFCAEGVLSASKEKKCGYAICSKETKYSFDITSETLDESRIYVQKVFPLLEGLIDNVVRLWGYICSEMLNNCIEHSQGKHIEIKVIRNRLYTELLISDDGVGAFKTVLDTLSLERPDATYEDAYMELVKGRYTSNPECHSGEGIFFSSRLADSFSLYANGYTYTRSDDEDSISYNRYLAYAMKYEKMGTHVIARIYNSSPKTTKGIFDQYSDADGEVYKTEIPLKSFCTVGDPVARSQARRICLRLDLFSEVIVDFDGIEFMGQGFADEMFRVFHNSHPEVKLTVANANEDIRRMLKHVGFKRR